MPECASDLPGPAVHLHQTIYYEGPITQSELVEETHWTRQTVTKYLDLLERKGLITIHPASDARSKLYATPDETLEKT